MLLLPSELQDQATAKAIKTMVLASSHFRREFPSPTVSFNLRGHTAGYADHRFWSIRINIDLLLTYPDEQIQVTVPHEVAHLVAHKLYGNIIAPHGWQWQAIMTDVFGVAPDRCHTMQTTAARQVAKYKVYCGCPSHAVTKVILRRMKQGRTYTCRKCGQHLSFNPVEKPKFDDLLNSIK